MNLWVYLATTPLFWLTATILAFLLACWVHEKAGRPPWANPVALSILLLMGVLFATRTPYPTYFAGAQFVHFMLGPATVCLAVPFWTHRHDVRTMALPLLAAILAGVVTAIGSAVGLAWWLGADHLTIASIVPKSVTAPVAMGIAEQIGGLPSLTAALVLGTGILGAMIGPSVLRRAGLRDPRAMGTAMGCAAHGIATAAAFQIDPKAGTYGGIAMALSGLLTAILVSLAVLVMG